MQTELIIISIFGVVIILLGVALFKLEKRFKKLFLGTNNKSLEEVMNMLGKYIEKLDSEHEETKKRIKAIDGKLAKTIRNVETVRFNPFPDAGGNQSFAIALLNDEGNGVVLSSLYARDRMSIFAKPITNHKSDHELTEEELLVVKKSK